MDSKHRGKLADDYRVETLIGYRFEVCPQYFFKLSVIVTVFKPWVAEDDADFVEFELWNFRIESDESRSDSILKRMSFQVSVGVFSESSGLSGEVEEVIVAFDIGGMVHE